MATLPIMASGRTLLRHTRWCRIARSTRSQHQQQARPHSTNNSPANSNSPNPTLDSKPPTASNKPQAHQHQHQPREQNAKASLWQRLGPITRAGAAVERFRARRPLTAQVTMTMVVFAFGDIAAQRIGGGGAAEFEPASTGKALLVAPGSAILTHEWMLFISQRLNLASRAVSVVLRVAATQAVFAPVICGYFFATQALLAGEGVAGIRQRLSHALPPAWRNGLFFWPFVQGISFTVVPLHYRALFNNTAGLFWQTYMAYLNQGIADGKRAAAAAVGAGAPASKLSEGKLGLNV